MYALMVKLSAAHPENHLPAYDADAAAETDSQVRALPQYEDDCLTVCMNMYVCSMYVCMYVCMYV